MRITRSLSGMCAANAFSSVVFPVPVPPDTRMFCCARTAPTSRSATAGVSVPICTSSSRVYRRVNFEGHAAPATAHGGNIAATRTRLQASVDSAASGDPSPQARASLDSRRSSASRASVGNASMAPSRSTNTRLRRR